MPDIRIYTNFVSSANISSYLPYEEDISDGIQVTNDAICAAGLRQARNLVLFAGNTVENMITASVRVIDHLTGSYRLRGYDSLHEEWIEHDSLIPAKQLQRGLPIRLERKGFAILQLQQEV